MQDRLDFLFDASGWKVREESPWHLCGEGRIGGREMLAVALCTEATSPLPAKAVADIAEFVRQEQERRLPLILIPSSVELLDEPHLAEAMGSLLGCLSGYRTRAPLLAAALDPLIGPVAMATRLADILCLAPKGSLSLAAESTRHQVPIVSEDLAFKTFLDCSFASTVCATS